MAGAVACGFVPALASAQSGTGSLGGVVQDGSGGAVPGATVKVINATSNVVVEFVTDGQGQYRATGLIPGPYRIEVSLDALFS